MYQILMVMRFILLLGLFSIHAASKPDIQTTLPLSEESVSQQIVKGYALKGMLTTVMTLYPDLPAHKALLFSPLIAEMSRDWALSAYGTFELIPNPEAQQAGRLKQEFATNTTLNKITRTLFNVADQVMVPTTQPSNPFLGLDANTVARMMQILHSSGLQGLITTLQTQCKGEQKLAKGKGETQPIPPTDDTVKQWYDTYQAINKSGKLSDLGRFEKAIRKKFIPLLTTLDEEATTPEGREKNVEDLSKLLMIYMFFKDKAEGASNPAYSIPEYLKALGNAGFKAEYETRVALERLDNLFKGKSDSPHLEPNAHGVEQVAFYLEDKIYGGIQALQTPYTTFKSTPITDPTNRFNGGEFPYCVEATIRSIINLMLYDPTTGKLNVHLLSTLAQESMDPEIKAFFEKYNDPLAPHYYQDTETEWLHLISGIEEVLYKQDALQGGFEINGLLGSKHILTALNHVFGRKTTTFEELATTLSKDIPGRTITFTPADSGYDLRVSDDTGPIAEGSLVDQEEVDHTAFLIKSGGFFDLLESKDFIPLVQKMNRFLEGRKDLFRICFTNKTLHPAWSIDEPMPLVFVMKKGLTEVLKTMLQYEIEPINYTKLIREAIMYSDSLEIATFLLSHIAQPNYKNLLIAAIASGQRELINFFLSHVENPDYFNLLLCAISTKKDDLPLIEQLLAHVSDPNYNLLITEAAQSGSFQKISFFFEKGANINGDGPNSTLTYALAEYFHTVPSKMEGLLKAIAFLVQNGAIISQENIAQAIETKNPDIVTVLLQHLTDPHYNELLLDAIQSKSALLTKLFIDKGANVNTKDDVTGDTPLSLAIAKGEISTMEILVQKGAKITDPDILKIIEAENSEFISFLLRNHILSQAAFSKALQWSIERNSLKILSLLIKEGINVNDIMPSAIASALTALPDFEYHIIKYLIQNKTIITEDNLEQAKSNPELHDLLEHEYTTQRYGIYLTQDEQARLARTVAVMA